MVKPKDILKFLLYVAGTLLLLSLLFNGNKLIISKNISIRFPSVQSILGVKNVEYADITKIIEQNEPDKPDTSNILLSASNFSVCIKTNDTIRADENSLIKNIRRIEYPTGDTSVLFPFFRELLSVKSSRRNIRIIHYGDSQIEGDRISSLIRARLQDRFGGSGPGMVPVVQPYSQFTVLQGSSNNWKRYTVYGNRDKSLSHQRYGAMAAFCRFSNGKIKDKQTESWIAIKKSGLAYENVNNYNCVKLFYGFNKKPFLSQIYTNDQLIDAEIIPVSHNLKIMEWDVPKSPQSITLKFKGDDSPEFYGISLESKNGIIVDNIPMRGSSGLIFTRIDRMVLKEMYEELNVKLVILQFGGNVVPYIADNYEQYGKLFSDQLKRLQALLPGVPVLVIGLADMSINEQGKFVTNPTVPKVRDELRKAAFEAGCAFWDMYEAMGGYNSMPGWVFANPAMASKDFVHFNYKGSKVIAEMLYRALIFEYNKYEGYINSKGIVLN